MRIYLVNMIYEAKFDGVTVRFILTSTGDRDVLVAVDDLRKVLKHIYPDENDRVVDAFWGAGNPLTETSGRSVRISDTEIIQAVPHFGAGGLINALSEFRENEEPRLRAFGYACATLFKWFSSTMNNAHDFFGIGPDEVMRLAVKGMDKREPAYEVLIEHDKEDGLWVATNEQLGLVVEADSYDDVVSESWDVAPDLADANISEGAGSDLRLRFVHDTAQEFRTAL